MPVILIIVFFISLLPLFYLWRRGLLPSMDKKKILLYALPPLIVGLLTGLPVLFLPIGHFYVAYLLFRSAFSKVLFIRLSSGEIIRIPVHPSSMTDASDLNRKLSEQVAQTRKV